MSHAGVSCTILATMKPRLLGTAGEFELGPKGATIGRDKSNTIRVDDPLVSSFHCRIERYSDEFTLVDCNSTNGTYVKGRLVEKVPLTDGDDIRIGQTDFLFALHDAPYALPPVSRIRLEDADENVRETVRLDPSDSSFLKSPEEVGRAQLDRLSQGVSVLFRLAAEINEAADSSTLQELLLQRIFELIPADNGAIVVTSAKNELILSSAVLRQRLPDNKSLSVSRSIAQTVMESGESILRNHLLEDESLAESLKNAQVCSVLCVPLTVMGAKVGVLYLNTTISRQEFNEWHLELATAIAGIAGIALEHLRYVEWLEAQNEQLKHEIAIRHDMIGKSPKMLQVFEDIARVAPGDARVLILGESGTGKELAARAIHNNSGRRTKPFVAVNCGQIHESLFASELFGHVKGAFTGADADRKGFVEEAHEGTLFLDEIGTLPTHLQPALLRVIEEGMVYRLGSTKPRKVDVRLISATNRSLKSEAEAGRFRADLFFRLGVSIDMPPLRERLEDIPLLVRFFLDKHRRLAERELGATPPETLHVLRAYPWPGNVRELEVAIQSAIMFGKSNRIRPEDLPKDLLNRAAAVAKPLRRLDDAKEQYERQLILRALEESRGVVSEAALLLDRVPTYLQRRISQLGLRDELKRIRLGG
jgi:two-component system response regulator HydG